MRSTGGLVRPLTDRESAILVHVVAGHPKGDALMQQIGLARIASDEVRSALEVEVLPGAPRISVENGLLSVDALIVDDQERLSGEIYLFMHNGYLSAMELGWYAEEPRVWPDASRLRQQYDFG